MTAGSSLRDDFADDDGMCRKLASSLVICTILLSQAMNQLRCYEDCTVGDQGHVAHIHLQGITRTPEVSTGCGCHRHHRIENGEVLSGSVSLEERAKVPCLRPQSKTQYDVDQILILNPAWAAFAQFAHSKTSNIDIVPADDFVESHLGHWLLTRRIHANYPSPSPSPPVRLPFYLVHLSLLI